MKIALSGLVVSLFAIYALEALRADERRTARAFVVPEAKQPKGFPHPARVDEIVIKKYPAYRAARVASDSMKQNSMFGELFNHIKKNQISMTAPVEMTYGEEGANSMAFLYVNTDIGETGSDGAVEVVDLPATTVVSIGVRGEYNQARFEKYRGQLEAWLQKNGDQWTTGGPPRYLGYNSPFVPDFLKYGEIQIPIQANDG